MSLVINHNSTADRIANQLSSHYGQLEKSTQRLSSGLRVNSAADDAAGLAIRELMRADVAALRQGIRNTNDAISMLQTADGALGIIDEKLIRMKELAEQAATGTYDSTQRAMIDSEFQMMASEIDRIARATDFNGIKLLDGEFERTETASSSGTATSSADPSISYDHTESTSLTNAKATLSGGPSVTLPVPENLEGTTTITVTNNNTISTTTPAGDVTITVQVRTGATSPTFPDLPIYWDSGQNRWVINDSSYHYVPTEDVAMANKNYGSITGGIQVNFGGTTANIYINPSNLGNVTGSANFS